MVRPGAVLHAGLLSLLVASVVLLSFRLSRLELAFSQLAPRSTGESQHLKPGEELPRVGAVKPDGVGTTLRLSGRRLLFVYSSSCPYSRQMFPVWAEMGRRAGFERTAYLSVDDPTATSAAIGSTPENGFLLPRESPLRARFSRVPQTIVVADGRVVNVDIGVLPPEAIERVLNDLNTSR